ncbi:hypothetical protein LIER_37986 [Lithospermum erythrorhizon]|uniref:RNA-directed DNA polymerase-like protein n=1 Tax=Lithospermum erythrorhizon TaxID=34254 RepID=A0AAV3PY24_LITER
MYTDFTSITKVCLKDFYPLPSIDRIVDSNPGYKVLDFLDVFQGYDQIFMAEEDVEKTAFVIDRATYQWMVNKVFSIQIVRNMEIYADDMLVKIWEVGDYEANHMESFENLRRNKLRLNPEKCVFGVTSEKFLEYMISARGIEPNPNKVVVVQAM